MKVYWAMVVGALICGCATRSAMSPAADTIDEAKAKLIAEQAVREKEHWRHVDSDVRAVERGWKVFVCRKPSRSGEAVVNVTVDERGKVRGYDKFESLE